MKKSDKFGYIFEAIFGIIFSLIFLYIVNVYYNKISFLTPDFIKVIPLYNLSLITGIIFHALRLVYRDKTFKTVTEIISNVIFLILAYNLWIIFPFDTSVTDDRNTWDMIFRLLIALPAFGVGIAIIVQSIELLVGKHSISSDTKKS